MSRKTFRRAVGAEPVMFDIEGAVTTQSFACRSSMSAGALLKFTETFSAEDIANPEQMTAAEAQQQGSKMLPMLKETFNAAIQKEAQPRFWEMVYDVDEEVGLDLLMDVISWLTEVFSGERPTTENSPRTSEEVSPGDGSGAGLSVVDTPTYSRSELTSSST